jgi:Bacterial protein of unknown function (DUF916)
MKITVRPLVFLFASALALTQAMTAVGAVPRLANTEEITWSVEPAPTAEGNRRSFDFSVDPGTQIVDSVRITNSGAATADFELYATDAINELDTGAFGLLERKVKPTDVGAWITLDKQKLTIEPGQQATVPFNLLVPSDAAPGDHVAGIVASVITQGESDGQAVTLEQRVGARVYLKVSGVPTVGVEASGLVSSFTPSLNPFAPGELTITYDVKNTGNLRLDVKQKIQIAGPLGIPLGEIKPETLKEVLPRQSIRVNVTVPAVAALALAWSTITLTPVATAAPEKLDSDEPEATPSPTPTPTPTPTPSPTVTPAPTGASTDELTDFPIYSSTVVTLAVSWTFLVLFIVVVAAVYFIRRYILASRERVYLAIDEAVAAAKEEAAREEAAKSNSPATVEGKKK